MAEDKRQLKGTLAPLEALTGLRGKGLDIGRREDMSGELKVAPSRLKGRGLEIGRKAAGITTELASVSTGEYRPVFGPELTLSGSLERDGFTAVIKNYISGQDAFAAKGSRFAVADGLGSSFDGEGASFLSMYLSERVVRDGIDSLVGGWEEVFHDVKATLGREFAASEIRGKLAKDVATTLTFAEVVAPGEVRIVTVGDSPAFVLDESGAIQAAFGESADLGGGAMSSGVDFDDRVRGSFKVVRGVPLPVDREDPESYITDTVIKVPEGHYVAIATDFFDKNPDLVKQIFQLIRADASHEYIDSAIKSAADSDDATIVFISPFVVP